MIQKPNHVQTLQLMMWCQVITNITSNQKRRRTNRVNSKSNTWRSWTSLVCYSYNSQPIAFLRIKSGMVMVGYFIVNVNECVPGFFYVSVILPCVSLLCSNFTFPSFRSLYASQLMVSTHHSTSPATIPFNPAFVQNCMLVCENHWRRQQEHVPKI